MYKYPQAEVTRKASGCSFVLSLFSCSPDLALISERTIDESDKVSYEPALKRMQLESAVRETFMTKHC